jgi:hypothetical protein
MTEQQPVERQELSPASLTYEQTRDELKGVAPLVRDKWQKADRSAATLLELYQSLQKDEDLVPEARQRRADEFYSREAPKIEKAWQETREELQGGAEALTKMATPRPKGENLEAATSDELLTAQNESARILRAFQRRASAPGPFKQSATDVLASEYAKGMKEGGVVGKARCRGTLAAAEELGVSPEEFLAPLRTEEQRGSLDRARRLEQAAYSIPSSAPRPGAALNSRVQSASNIISKCRNDKRILQNTLPTSTRGTKRRTRFSGRLPFGSRGSEPCV